MGGRFVPWGGATVLVVGVLALALVSAVLAGAGSDAELLDEGLWMGGYLLALGALATVLYGLATGVGR